MRGLKEGSNHKVVYFIEEYQSKWHRWVSRSYSIVHTAYNLKLIDRDILHSKMGVTACGDCWQETGLEGIYSLEYAKQIVNLLNNDLIKTVVHDIDCSMVTEYRICKITYNIEVEYIK